MATIRIECDLEGVPAGQWIEGSDEITRKRYKQWMAETNDARSEEMAPTFITRWHLFNADGSEAPQMHAFDDWKPTIGADGKPLLGEERPSAFDGLTQAMVGWVFGAITVMGRHAEMLPLGSKSPWRGQRLA